MSTPLPPSARLDHELVWVEVFAEPGRFSGRPALFLDRDGAVIEEKHYLSDPDQVVLENGAAAVVRRCNEADIAAVIVTNQSGIARGYYGWDAFAAVQDRLIALLAAEGARVDAVFACGHHKNGVGDYQHPDHPARKPNPGMLLRARDLLGVDLASSWIVGDRAADMTAGRNAGLAGGLHVLTGHGTDDGERDKALAKARDGYEVRTGGTIGDAERLPLF
jgi:D-glycero-D-manno-heptose 1,7-bisphosphate phosphatase